MPAIELKGRGVAVIVTGGIAAYKVCDLVSTLTKAGASVRVVMTESACRFVGEMTFATLSGNPVCHDLWARRSDVQHVALADFADVAIVAPATANIIGKYAHGIADDL
ncbi:MAG: flavoprotein, partial [Armatimonadota bacterium]